jgi:hypothetical protein
MAEVDILEFLNIRKGDFNISKFIFGFHFIYIFIFIVVPGSGVGGKYIVQFTKLLKMYQIYHT